MSKQQKLIEVNGRHYYSESFKKYVVDQIEKGKLGKEEARIKYKIAGNSAILNWCRQYGKHYQMDKIMNNSKYSEEVYKRRIKELEKELAASKLRSSYLECVIDIAEKEMGIPIEKKFDARQSQFAEPKKFPQA